MTSMSYCRFRNTLDDLRECEAALTVIDTEPLQPDEHKAMLRLVKMCQRIASDYADSFGAEADSKGIK